MSFIQLAAQRSLVTNEPISLPHPLPSFKKGAILVFVVLIGGLLTITVGIYAHIYWNLRYPDAETTQTGGIKRETRLSDMHYVYVTKPFPPLALKSVPRSIQPAEALSSIHNASEWQQIPEGDFSRKAEHVSESRNDAAVIQELEGRALKEQFIQALKEQQRDYERGNVPASALSETATSRQDP